MDDKSWLDELRKHNAEWEKYAARMKEFQWEWRIASECCGENSYDIWDYEHNQWVCNVCKSTVSNDPSYTGGRYKAPVKDDVFKPLPVDGKCICTIQTLMSTGCKCNGK